MRNTAQEEKPPLTPATLGVGTDLEVYDIGDGPTGMEGLDLDEQLTPFVRILQGLSPQLNPSKSQYIPGAKLGMLFNTATGEVYDAIDVIICAREHVFGQWIPRDLGEGFRGNLLPDDPLVRQTIARMALTHGASAKFKLPRYDGKTRRWSDEPARTKDTDEEVELVETGNLYVIYGPTGNLSPATAQRALIAMTVTSYNEYKSIMTRHGSWKWLQSDGSMRVAKLWTYRWQFKAVPATNANGQEYFVWKAGFGPPAQTYQQMRILPNDPLYIAAEEFNKQFRDGVVKADYETAAQTVSREAGDDTEMPPF